MTHSEILMPWYKVYPGQDGVSQGQVLSGPLPTMLLGVPHPSLPPPISRQVSNGNRQTDCLPAKGNIG